MKDDKPVNDTELHAYLDDQLDHKQREEIEKSLAADHKAAEKLEDYKNIDQLLHSVYDPVLDEEIPERLLRTSSRQSNYRAAAASLIFFLFGAVFGWQSQLNLAGNIGPAPSTTVANLVQPAMFAHAVYAVEVAHPVEVNAEQHQHLNKWLSKRLKTNLTAPDLTAAGYRLIGGRLLPSTEDRMAAQYMYEDKGGQRITLYVRRGDWGHESQAINYSQQKGYSMFYWTDEDLGYALTSEMNNNKNKELAKEVYKQMSLNSIRI